jgi:hypothetical protein
MHYPGRGQPQHNGKLQCLGAGHAQRADLSGRRGVLPDPRGQGDAGAEAARLRHSRDQARQAVQSWGQLEAAKSNIEATRARVQASEIGSTACVRKLGRHAQPGSTDRCGRRKRCEKEPSIGGPA